MKVYFFKKEILFPDLYLFFGRKSVKLGKKGSTKHR